MKTTVNYKGVPMTLHSSQRSRRITDGHGCKVTVGMLSFRSEYMARKFIDCIGGNLPDSNGFKERRRSSFWSKQYSSI